MEDRPGTNELPLLDLTILIAEDQFLIALDVESMMRDAGADILGPYLTVPSALEAAAHERVSAAVLDFRLGQETTKDVAEILVARAIPFIFYTGQSLPEDLPKAPVVAKPANRRVLVEAIAAAVRGSGVSPVARQLSG